MSTASIHSAEPGDLPELRQLEQRARLLAVLEGADPDETYTEPHPLMAGVNVTHVAWHVFARKLVNAARILTVLKDTEEGVAQKLALHAASGQPQ